MIFNLISIGGGSSAAGATLAVSAPAGAAVTARMGEDSRSLTAGADGSALFTGLPGGSWTVTIAAPGQLPVSREVVIVTDYTLALAFFAAWVEVTYPEGDLCTCQCGDFSFTAPDRSGSVTFQVPMAGSWVFTAVSDDTGEQTSQTLAITQDGQRESLVLRHAASPADFGLASYGALDTNYQVLYDDDTPIPQELWSSAPNWKIRLLTSGTLTPLKNSTIDVFCVGAGGGTYGGRTYPAGGGGGYTRTAFGVSLTAATPYPITIGAGVPLKAGEATSAFGITAAGGNPGTALDLGGNGGSGGMGGRCGGTTGGVNGGDGTGRTSGPQCSGFGQIAVPGPNGETGNTSEFGQEGSRVYANGGSGGNGQSGGDGAANTGNGGSGKPSGASTSGGSGIVVIRNARSREVTA